MRMEQLKYLVDVAETKSMTKTAERLFVTPQAVSKNIKQLEMELDTVFLVRTSMGAELTHVGAAVVALARDMLEKELQMKQMIAADKKRTHYQQSFTIRICSTSAIANMLLPGIIAKFVQMGIH
ncbi:MAG: LysR family transcriptional regulator, partial [Peptococcaceae bacterium]|nr:LysR family transcriptional regulator [Peptococcaceae bacterium]